MLDGLMSQQGIARLNVLFDHRAATFLLPMVRSIRVGDALICPHAKLERIKPEVGFEHYILYQNGVPSGLQYVRAVTWLNEVQKNLAAYLTIIGFTVHNTRLKPDGATTPLKFEHNRIRHLFEFSLPELDEDDEL